MPKKKPTVRKKRAAKKSTTRKASAAKRKASAIPAEWPAAKTEKRKLSQLIPYARNSRTHSPEQVKRIAASIREWGWTIPVLVAEDNTIIAGHGRVLAAELEGIEVVPVMVARGWTKSQIRAYAIADNKIALDAGWDMDILRTEIDELSLDDFDLDLTGFGALELKGLFGNDDLERADAAVVPPKRKKAVTKAGDCWMLGEHLVYCGDASDADSWEGVEADMIWTDPPYGVSYVGKTKDKLEIVNDRLSAEKLEEFLSISFRMAADHSKPGAPWYVAAPPGPQFLQFAKPLDALGIWRQTIAWVKDVFVMGHSDFHYKHESLFYGWNPGGAHKFYGDRKNDTVWEIPRPKRSKEHPTMKPLSLIAKSLKLSSQEGDLVVDPFGGSGSTMMACETLNRRCYSIELDACYADVMVRRWQEHTGEIATLDGDGRSFAEIDAEGR